LYLRLLMMKTTQKPSQAGSQINLDSLSPELRKKVEAELHFYIFKDITEMLREVVSVLSAKESEVKI
jgi:hypothetical protein